MLMRFKKPAFVAGLGFSTLSIAVLLTALAAPQSFKQFAPWGQSTTTLPGNTGGNPSAQQTSAVFPLVSLLSPSERSARLDSIVKGAPSLDRNRARFLKASDLLNQGNPKGAIAELNRLENDYQELAPYVFIKRAQAYAAMRDNANMDATWAALVAKYPNDPGVVEGLYQMGQKDPKYWDQAIAQYPAHPRSVEIAQIRLSQNPKNLQAMLLLAKYGIHLEGIKSILDRLKTDYAAQLKPEDWEAIAYNYWENQNYSSAGAAYAKAPPSALNLYRAGRGAQLGERGGDAIKYYEQVIQAFPKEEEAGRANVKLADLAKTPELAVAYCDRAIQLFPDRAPEALLKKSDIFQNLNSPDTALKLRQQLLTQYGKSPEAAEIRWRQAQANAKKGDVKAAWEWAQQIVTQNPDSEHSSEAAYWVGKWAQQLGLYKEATQAFEYVLKNYPETYYAWRSATMLGWDVGDFTTVRQKLPHIVKPGQRTVPPAGSATVRELYQMGQNQEAWNRWQVEHTKRVNTTVAEQFTDGLMRLGVGDNLDAIYMVASLANREKKEDRDAYTVLKQQPAYWQALYPFPFSQEVEQWSLQRQINPMLVTGLIRQESRFEPKIQSSVGATGLMQLMPETASWVSDQVKLKNYKLDLPNDNINLGTWYLDYTHREYNNNSLFAVASYNAGPGAVAEWIQKYGFSDPDKFIDQIPYDETQGYVKHVFENYWNYLRLYNPETSTKMKQFMEKR
jgi:soluble lytic murein transglycosylase